MYTENTVSFTDDIIRKTGYNIWVHSRKGKLIRIALWAVELLLLILAVSFLLRRLVLHTSMKPFFITFVLMLLDFAAIAFVLPIIYCRKVQTSIPRGLEQIVTMDEHYVNIHSTGAHQQLKWFKFTDMDEDESCLMLFSPEVFVVLDRNGFPEGGEEIFLSMRTPARLLRELRRKSKKERYLIPFEKDLVTPLVKRIFK